MLPTREQTLAERLRDGVTTVPGVRILRRFTDAPDRVGVVTVEIDDLPAGLVAAALSAEHGIGVRDGRWVPTPDPRDLDPLGVGERAAPAGCEG